MDSDKAVTIIKQIGVGDLGYFDGCLCAHFHVSGISVDVSCRKSSGAKPKDFWGIMVRVYSSHLYHEPLGLRDVAIEVVRQLRDSSPDTPLMVRYCDYAQDKELKCVYCSKPRADYESYLCDECKRRTEAKAHDYSSLQPVGA